MPRRVTSAGKPQPASPCQGVDGTRIPGQPTRGRKPVARAELQLPPKTREGANHPDRDAQFAHINATVKAAIADGEPAISVDIKKKKVVGDFKNNGRELRPKGQPEAVRVHDFKIPELGKVAPYGVYDIASNHGWVSLGIDADTAAFAVESIRRWGRSWARRATPMPPAW